MVYEIYISDWRSEPLGWKIREHASSRSDEVQVRYTDSLSSTVAYPPTRRGVVNEFKDLVQKRGTEWLAPGFEAWVLDLDALRVTFPELSALSWFSGKVSVVPEVTIREDARSILDRQSAERNLPPLHPAASDAFFLTAIEFTIVPEVTIKAAMLAEAPLGIHHSLKHFRIDHPDPQRVAFIMMRFGTSSAHDRILEGIKGALATAGITGVRADEYRYHDDLFNHVLTFMHGCGFGIAVFENLEDDDLNSNVALEVGYMLAMSKEVCILKDQALPTLQTDLMGKMYSPFDSRDPAATIPKSLSVWLRAKKLIMSASGTT